MSGSYADALLVSNKLSSGQPMETPLGDGFTIYSGRALGMDSVTEFAAKELGMNMVIKIPPAHPRARAMTPLTESELDQPDPYVKSAAKILNRSI